jgi:hypothetical protein
LYFFQASDELKSFLGTAKNGHVRVIKIGISDGKPFLDETLALVSICHVITLNKDKCGGAAQDFHP